MGYGLVVIVMPRSYGWRATSITFTSTEDCSPLLYIVTALEAGRLTPAHPGLAQRASVRWVVPQ